MLLVEKKNWYTDEQQTDGGDNPPAACWSAKHGLRFGMQKFSPALGPRGPVEPFHGSSCLRVVMIGAVNGGDFQVKGCQRPK